MPVARPRTISLSPEEMIKLGEEMIAWVIANKPFHLSQWYTIEKMYTHDEWKTMRVCPEFFPYYEKALKLVGIQYLDKTSNIRDSISQRWQRVYFKDLKEEEDETAAYNESLKAKEENKLDPQALTQFAALMNQLGVRQDSDSKIAESKIIKDAKS